MELCHYPSPEKNRFYEIEAIEIPIVYNKYGDHDPNGLLYVLKKDADRIREGAMRNFSQETLAIGLSQILCKQRRVVESRAKIFSAAAAQTVAALSTT